MTLTVNDDDGGTDTDTASVTVANADPVANAGVDKTGTEGSSVSFTFNCTDAGVNDTWDASVDWGDGSADTTFAAVDCNTATTFNASHTYADDDGSPFTVTLTVNDDDGGTDTDTASVSVANADPIANAGVDKTGTEGSSVSFTFNCTDAGVNDTWDASVDWGDGSADTTFATVDCNTATTFNASHTYADDDGSPFTVTLTVNDDDGGTDTDTASVSVANADPIANAGVDKTGTEGSSVSFTFNCTDAGVNDTWDASVDWGDGSADTTFATVDCNTATTFNASHTYADDDGSPFTVTLTVNDDDGGTDTDTASVTIANAAPEFTEATATFNYNPFTGNASAGIDFSDPGWADTHSVKFNWAGTLEDGIVTYSHQASPAALGHVADSYKFPEGCIAGGVSVVITDDDAGTDSYVFATPGSLNRYVTTWMAPVKDGMRNVVKHGNVIPLKIRVVDCLGNPATGKTLTVGVVNGVVTANDIEDGTVVIQQTESVGAHTDGIMRYVDSHYMYNLATKPLKVGLPYTVVIREQGTNNLVTTAVIEPKK